MTNEDQDTTRLLVAEDYQKQQPALNAEQLEVNSTFASDETVHGVVEAVTLMDGSSAQLKEPGFGLSIGDVLKGRFQIVEQLGEGGMGMVFKAIDMRKVEAKSHNPHIAIKVLHPALARNELLVAGLQRESEKAQALSHPNIITVYDFDRDGDHVFMSMEFLSGRSLSRIIREAAVAGGLKIQYAWPIIQKMGEALAYAHLKHIVHSDFKPGNVIVTDAGEVKVLDFGIAARTGQAGDSDLTVFNARAEGGLTPPYASFEMMNGAAADPRDDIYAFGIVVYELLTGKHPYDRKPASAVFIEQQGSSGNKPSPLVVKGLSRKQWQLLKSTIEILQDKRPKSLDTWLKQFDPGSKRPWLKTSGIAVLMVLVLGAGVNWWLTHRMASQNAPGVQESIATVESLTPSVVPKLPVANAGNAQQAKVGAVIQLNGGESQTGDGNGISYSWRLVELPAGSKAILQDAGSAAPQFVPDLPGVYSAELLVRDAHNSSLPALVRIDVDALMPQTVNAHEATSTDGVVRLSASKSRYKIGEELKLNVWLAKAGYLRVAYVGAGGEISELLPNPYQASRVKAEIEYKIPPRPDKFKLEITGPLGTDRIVAVFSEQALPKVRNIANPDGSIVAELQNSTVSVAQIQYEVVKK